MPLRTCRCCALMTRAVRVRARANRRSRSRIRGHSRRRYCRACRLGIRRTHHIQIAQLRSVVADVQNESPERDRLLDVQVVDLYHPQPIVLIHRPVIRNGVRGRAAEAMDWPASMLRRYVRRRARVIVVLFASCRWSHRGIVLRHVRKTVPDAIATVRTVAYCPVL